MNKKRTGIIIILIGLFSILAMVYFMFFYKPAISEEVVIKDVDVILETEKEIAKPLPKIAKPKPRQKIVQTEQKKEISKDEISQVELKRFAASFAERFGSFSNQSNFQNLKDLMIFMSIDMRARTDSYIEKSLNARGDASTYYGVSTKAIATSIKEFSKDKNEATVIVATLRQEATETTSNISDKNQDIEIKLVKEKDVWKVDEASWR